MKTRKSRGGRPGRAPKPGERVKLGLRVTPELKRRLDAAAEQSGRSQSQEAELRLARSFEREEMLPEVLSLAYSKETAGILIALGLVLEDTKRLAQNSALNVGGRIVMTSAPVANADLPSYALDQAIKAAMEVLEEMRPADAPPTDNFLALCMSDTMLHAIRGDGDENWFTGPGRETIGPLLGKIVQRMREQAKDVLPVDQWSMERPIALARAVTAAYEGLHAQAALPPKDVSKLLEHHLKDFLPHDWERRGRDKAASRKAMPDEPENESRRRA